MAKKQRYEVLLDYLREQPGNRATIRQIHVDCYIQNVAEAKRQAVLKGFNITTERDKDNPKVASYVLHQPLLSEEASMTLLRLAAYEYPSRQEKQTTLIKEEPKTSTRAYSNE